MHTWFQDRISFERERWWTHLPVATFSFFLSSSPAVPRRDSFALFPEHTVEVDSVKILEPVTMGKSNKRT
jgi:hypothetical protein